MDECKTWLLWYLSFDNYYTLQNYTGHLWKKETDNKYCEFHDDLIFDVIDQRGCQTKCEAKKDCVGITYSHAPDKKQICYVCLFDDLSPITGGFAFYRRPGTNSMH